MSKRKSKRQKVKIMFENAHCTALCGERPLRCDDLPVKEIFGTAFRVSYSNRYCLSN